MIGSFLASRLTVVALVASPVVVAGPAAADWHADGSGSGQAMARTLGAPTSVTATCRSLSAIRVDWDATQAPPYVDSYEVARSRDGASWQTVGSPVTATDAASHSLTDSGLGLGTYRYRVTAGKATNWRTHSSSSNPRTITLLVCS
jgi:hypothetical protein